MYRLIFVVYRWILKQLGDDLTEADIDDMIADVDTDGSGWVDFEGKRHLHIHHPRRRHHHHHHHHHHRRRRRINSHTVSQLFCLHRPKPIHCNYSLAHYSGFCRISPSILNRFKPNLQA